MESKPDRAGLLRIFFTVACVFALAAGWPCASSWPAKATEAVQLRFSTIPTIDNAAFEVALAKNFFGDEGLAISPVPTVGGSAGIPALVSGQLQAASSNIVSIILAAAQGLEPVMVIAGDTTGDAPPDLLGLVGKKGAPYKSGKDLEGKTIAINSRNNIVWLFTREWIEKTGGDPAKVAFVEVPFPQIIDAVQNNRVDAGAEVEPFLSAAVDAGTVDIIGWPYSATQKRLPVAEFAMTKTYADAHPDIVARLIKAYDRGVDWTNANLDSPEFDQIVSHYTKVQPELLKRVTKPVFVKTVDLHSVELVVSLMKKHGLLKTDVDAKAIVYPAIAK
jgi:NitT/TauT family transport system substrate-binding protein